MNAHPPGKSRLVAAVCGLMARFMRAWKVRCAPTVFAAIGVVTSTAFAAGITGADITEVVVSSNRIVLTGEPRSASEGTVLAEQLENRPLLRTGELLEVVPGMIVTQHTGDGKANQYFLRGVNLDHGTDFATRVEGMPVNMPTHGHGQGYMDVNFVIPELIESIVYRKGTYYPELGNFSAAGAASISYSNASAPRVSFSTGRDGYARTLAAGSTALAGGNVLVGLEHARSDGPWQRPQDFRKYNALVRYSQERDSGGFNIDLMGYDGRWNGTDQVPARAVDGGMLDRFGFVDPASGGETHRYSLSLQGSRDFEERSLQYAAYALDSHLQLFSNFTYSIDPDRGDQFEQYDDRRVYGGELSWSQPIAFGPQGSTWRIGVDMRHDDISPVGLHLTTARVRHDTVREDQVRQTLGGLWSGLATRWNPWLRTEIGMRADRLEFEVESDLADNSGRGSDRLASPKLSVTLGPWADTEYFAGLGRGFHSNDSRGATISVDPTDQATPVDRVAPLVPASGAEIGLRTALFKRTQLSAAVWQLDIDSELVFIGDGGTTEASLASRRRGLELGLYSRPLSWLILDADLAVSRPRFRGSDGVGDRIPGAVERAASLGLAVEFPSGWFGGARLRYLGPAALIEDDSVRSSSSTLANLEFGRSLGERWRFTASVYNVFDRKANDVTYFYESELPGESAPIADLHFHPVEPRTFRLTTEFRL